MCSARSGRVRRQAGRGAGGARLGRVGPGGGRGGGQNALVSLGSTGGERAVQGSEGARLARLAPRRLKTARAGFGALARSARFPACGAGGGGRSAHSDRSRRRAGRGSERARLARLLGGWVGGARVGWRSARSERARGPQNTARGIWRAVSLGSLGDQSARGLARARLARLPGGWVGGARVGWRSARSERARGPQNTARGIWRIVSLGSASCRRRGGRVVLGSVGSCPEAGGARGGGRSARSGRRSLRRGIRVVAALCDSIRHSVRLARSVAGG